MLFLEKNIYVEHRVFSLRFMEFRVAHIHGLGNRSIFVVSSSKGPSSFELVKTFIIPLVLL